jgi:hypothetical protein
MPVAVPLNLVALAERRPAVAVEHLASARYLAGSVARPIAGAVGGLSRQIYRSMKSNNNQSQLERRMAAGADAAARMGRVGSRRCSYQSHRRGMRSEFCPQRD